MQNFKKTVESIKQSWNERLEQATDKKAELALLTQELAIAVAEEHAETFIQKASDLMANNASNQQNGLRSLSPEESNFYKELASNISNPKQALTANLDDIFPVTIINRVFEDLKQEHKLLKVIDIAPAGLTKWLIGSSEGTAGWGTISKSIIDEISATIEPIDLTTNKATAFFAIFKGIVDLGYSWLDLYVREVLSEALYIAIEKAIIVGTGKDEPIGMMKNLDSSSNGIYADKAAIAITDFSPKSYGGALVTLTNEGKRSLKDLIMLVNPQDYLQKVMPAIAFRTPNGEYINVLPYPTNIIELTEVPKGKAVVGLPKNYFFGASGLRMQVCTELKAIEDQYLYIAKIYGNGQPKDNKSFVVLDISNVKEMAMPVTVEGIVQTKEQAGA